jgi:hypothetical protein
MKNIQFSFILILLIFGCKIEEDNIVAINPLKDNATMVVEVKSRTGRIWMDRNLGASQVATSPTDEKAYGDLYQWGRGADGHQKRTSDTTFKKSSTDVPGNALFIINQIIPLSVNITTPINPYGDWRNPQNDNLWQGVTSANNPCPAGFRLPTELEWYEEQKSWLVGINSEGAFASPLKLPLAGGRPSLVIGNTFFSGLGDSGNYWSSTIATRFFQPFLQISQFMYFSTRNPGLDNSGNRLITASDRGSGLSIRCIKN